MSIFAPAPSSPPSCACNLCTQTSLIWTDWAPGRAHVDAKFVRRPPSLMPWRVSKIVLEFGGQFPMIMITDSAAAAAAGIRPTMNDATSLL